MGLIESLKRALNRSKSNQIESMPIETPSTIEIEKDSLQLGVAAGYTGRSLKDIESSLTRIESQMATKEWVAAEILPTIYLLKEKYQKIDIIEQKLNELSISVAKTSQIASNLPEPMKAAVQEGLKNIENLTWRMKEILSIVKQCGEISYEELATQLNYKDKSALRSILSSMVKRTSEIQRFEKENKGWIKYMGELNRSDSIENAIKQQ